ncbi:MAG: DEAD/DEAH box helicase [Desulfosalsimonadaceae bacterium]
MSPTQSAPQKNPKSPDPKLIKRYLDLPPLEQRILRILAVNIESCFQTQVFICLGLRGHTDKSFKKPVSNVFKSALDKLQREKLISKDISGFFCPEAIRLRIVGDMVKNGEFKAIAAAVQQIIPSENDRYSNKAFRSFKLGLRDLQCLVYTGQGKMDVETYLGILLSHYPFESRSRHPLISLFSRPFDAEVMDAAPEKTRFQMIAALVNECQFLLEPASEAFAYLKRYRTHPDVKPLFYRYIHAQLFSDEARLVRESLSLMTGKDIGIRQAALTGWFELVSGNTEAALSAFREGFQAIKKQGNRNYYIHINGYPSIFFPLALLKSGRPEDMADGAKYIKAIAKSREPNFAKQIILALRPLFEDFQGDLPIDPQTAFAKIPEGASHIDTLFYLLAQTWTGAPPPEDKMGVIENYRDEVLSAGLTWVGAEYCAFLAKLGHDAEKNRKTAEALHKECGTMSLVDIVKVQQPWEKVLRSLIALHKEGPEPDGAAEGPGQRLIWLLDYSETTHTCQVFPRLQKRNKNGEWSAGRNVALKTLLTDSAKMDGLTDQDRLVCGAIELYSHRSGYYYYGTEYRFNMTKALPALVGHPFLMLQSSPGVHVELVPGKPEVRIEKTRKALRLTMIPMPTEYSRDVMVVRETPTRFKLVRFTAEHQRMALLLSQGIAIPNAAEPLVREAAGALSSIVSVQSDLAGVGHIREVPADATPHAHVMPYQEGIRLEFLAKPLGENGPCFTPGKGGKTVVAVMEGEKVQTTRDLLTEKQRLDGVVDKCPLLAGLSPEDGEWLVDDPETALEALLELKDCEGQMTLSWPQGEKLKVRREVSFNGMSMTIKKDRDWFKATGNLQIDDQLSVDLKKILELLDGARGRFIPLDDGVFVAVTKGLRKRLEELKAFSDPHGDGVRFSPLASPALEGLTGNLYSLTFDEAWKDHCKRLSTVVEPKLPSTLQAHLREYQVAGFNWLAQLSHWGVGACLADDMGLGKTVQALAAILLTAAKGPTLVVAPLSVMANWETECQRFAPTLNVTVFGPGDRQAALSAIGPFDLLIASYGLLAIEAEKLAGVEWEIVVLDEAQAIKNMNTQRSKAAMSLNARFRMATTGTPLENHLGELWTLFHFLNPGLLGSFKRFNERFAVPIERDRNREANARLRKLIRPFLLRRLKSEVLQELPEKTEVTLEVEMSREEALLYEAQRMKSLEAIAADASGPADKRFRILAEIMKLRRLCCNPALVLPDCAIASSKLKVFGDVVAELVESNHKALVFSQFVGHLSLIRELLDERKIKYQYLDGSTSAAQRKERINAFQAGEGEVFLISLKAGGFGLNLTAADYVIHMDPWWNPAVEDQASDRAHRIGQQRPVTVYRLVVKDSIEEQIVSLHKEKRDLADSILTGGDVSGKVSAEELLRLLQGR